VFFSSISYSIAPIFVLVCNKSAPKLSESHNGENIAVVRIVEVKGGVSTSNMFLSGKGKENARCEGEFKMLKHPLLPSMERMTHHSAYSYIKRYIAYARSTLQWHFQSFEI
jgi:hypothetical protein